MQDLKTIQAFQLQVLRSHKIYFQTESRLQESSADRVTLYALFYSVP